MRWLGLLLLVGCHTPPPEAYVNGPGAGSRAGAQVAIGKNAVGEDCTQAATEKPDGSRSAAVYCGTWQQPSARVTSGGVGNPAALAIKSDWRTGIDARFRCEAPVATTILSGAPAQLLHCTRLVGGWAHVGLVALVSGRIWFADGVLPAAGAMERSIGVLAGTMRADAAPADSAADALFASRLAAQSYSAGDVGQFDALMKAGTRANLANNAAAAEAAFRAALSVQQKALGKDNPNTAIPMMALALELSDEGRFADAEPLFARAEALAPNAVDPLARARLAHYRGIDLINQGKADAALSHLAAAEQAYAAEVPDEALRTRIAPQSANPFTRAAATRFGDLTLPRNFLTSPAAQSALLGVVEVRRAKAIALRLLHRTNEADAALASANGLARGNGLTKPILTARLYRTSGFTAGSAGRDDAALDELTRSAAAFGRALPGSRPLADANLLYAGQLVRGGDIAGALAPCRTATMTLVGLKTGTTPALMAPCLTAFAANGTQDALAEMFVASQLAQGSITSQQIAQAGATLAENARDPKVAAAIRQRRDLKVLLDTLYSKRDELTDAPDQAASVEKQIAETEAKAADADVALQAASPNFGQLVQDTVRPSELFSALRVDEAFVSVALSEREGWVFALRDGKIAVARIGEGTEGIGTLVRTVRAGIELTGTRLPDFDIAGARRLYDLTLGQVAATLAGAKSVAIAPSGPLLALPFEVLLTGPADAGRLAEAPWLLRRFVLTHVPAPANFVSLRKVAGGSHATRPWFGFGAFRPVTPAQAERSFPPSACGDAARTLASLPPLPYARKELDAARALLGADPADALLGDSFTAGRVLATPLKDYRILQFSTHALLPTDLRCQNEPAIVTSAPAGAADAKGALLTASQVIGLDLDADLVILSACNSGGPGGTTAGESLSGLARAFFYAGARSLLVTHWSVNDQVAAYLVAGTLGRMRGDPSLGVTGAMRAAQVDMLEHAGKDLPAEIAHPFFWAPFAVIGEGSAGAGGHV